MPKWKELWIERSPDVGSLMNGFKVIYDTERYGNVCFKQIANFALGRFEPVELPSHDVDQCSRELSEPPFCRPSANEGEAHCQIIFLVHGGLAHINISTDQTSISA